MLMNLPILEEDILEVASFASDFENQIPTASKALLDNCTSLLASKLRTPDDFAQFARKASKGPFSAPMAIKLLAGMSNCAESSHLEVDISQETDLKPGWGFSENKVKEDDCVSSLERLKSKEEPVCSNCKVLKRNCLIGQEVRYIKPKQVSYESNNLHTNFCPGGVQSDGAGAILEF